MFTPSSPSHRLIGMTAHRCFLWRANGAVEEGPEGGQVWENMRVVVYKMVHTPAYYMNLEMSSIVMYG